MARAGWGDEAAVLEARLKQARQVAAKAHKAAAQKEAFDGWMEAFSCKRHRPVIVVSVGDQLLRQ